MARRSKRRTDDDAITVKELTAEIPNLKVTERQREFIRAAFRACLTAALERRMGCRVDI